MQRTTASHTPPSHPWSPRTARKQQQQALHCPFRTKAVARCDHAPGLRRGRILFTRRPLIGEPGEHACRWCCCRPWPARELSLDRPPRSASPLRCASRLSLSLQRYAGAHGVRRAAHLGRNTPRCDQPTCERKTRSTHVLFSRLSTAAKTTPQGISCRIRGQSRRHLRAGMYPCRRLRTTHPPCFQGFHSRIPKPS